MSNQVKMSKSKFQNWLIKIIEYLFYLFIFLLPWQTRFIYQQGVLNGNNWEYGTFSLYSTELLLGLIFLGLIILFFAKVKSIKLNYKISWLNILVLVFLAYSLLSLIWSVNKEITWYKWLLLVDAVAVFFIIRGLKLNFKKIAHSFVLAGLVQSGLAIYQFLTQSIGANKWLGISAQLVGQGGVSVVEGAGRWLRAYGSWSHPNMLGGWLVVCLFFLIALLFQYHRENYQPPWRVSKALIGRAVWLFGSLVIISYALLLTFSRSAWLGLIVGLLMIWLFLWQRKAKPQLKFFGKVNFILILVLVMFVVNYSGLLYSRLNTGSRLEAQSVAERQVGWQQAIEIIKDSPFLGVGLGGYTQALYDNDSTRPAWEYQPVHNLDLLILAELGIIGWLLLTIIVLGVVYQGLKKMFPTSELSKLLILATVMALLIIGLFDHYLWSFYSGLILAAIVLGLLNIKRGRASVF